MKKSLVVLLTVLMMFALVMPAHAMTDVKEGDWFYSDVTYLINQGGINGYPDGTFKPNNTITQAEFLKIVMTVSQPNKGFPEVEGHWAANIFEDATNQKVVLKNELTKWDEPITRYEMARVMVRVLNNVLDESETATTGASKLIADYNKIPNNYKPFVEQAYMKGLITGMDSKGTFAGDKTGTRAEAATMISRMLEPNNRIKIKSNSKTRYPILDQYEDKGITKADQLTPEVVEALKGLYDMRSTWTKPSDANFAEHKEIILRDLPKAGSFPNAKNIVVSKDLAWMEEESAIINGEEFYAQDWYYLVVIDGKQFARASVFNSHGGLKATIIPAGDGPIFDLNHKEVRK